MENSGCIIRSKEEIRRKIEKVTVIFKDGEEINFFNVKNAYYSYCSEGKNNMWEIICEQEIIMIAREEIKSIKVIYQKR